MHGPVNAMHGALLWCVAWPDLRDHLRSKHSDTSRVSARANEHETKSSEKLTKSSVRCCKVTADGAVSLYGARARTRVANHNHQVLAHGNMQTTRGMRNLEGRTSD